MYSVIDTFEKMVAVNTSSDTFYMDRQERAKHFVKMVRKFIIEECKVLRILSGNCENDYVYTGVLLMRDGIRHNSTYSPIGFFDESCFFLNSAILYEKIGEMSERNEISINAPALIYYTDLLMAGVIKPSDRPRDRTAFRMKINGAYDRFVCVSNDVLHINAREILMA